MTAAVQVGRIRRLFEQAPKEQKFIFNLSVGEQKN